MQSRLPVLLCGLITLVGACADTEVREVGFQPEILPLPAPADEYAPIAAYEPMRIPEDNPITPEKAALGRQLYYDTRLSGDKQLACYSCHVCEEGLTDGRPTAIGAFGKPVNRKSPTMWNIGYHEAWYWDGRAGTLEGQALAAWGGANMGADTEKVVAELNALEDYREQFQQVFNEDATPENVSKALATYMRTIIGASSAWDQWQAGDSSAVSEAAKRGWEVFKKAACDNCHSGVLLTDLQYHNVGIGMDREDPDLGRFNVTKVERDRGAFKTPTLRDVARRSYFFHDGRASSLEEAVDLMLDGGIQNPWLDEANIKPVKLSQDEKADLLEFLRSLNQPCEFTSPPLPTP